MVGPKAIATGATVREFVIKIHERCNIACDHCYMYEAVDQHWRERPAAMDKHTLDQIALRLAEHAQTHGLDEIRVVLHGGEPLLAGTTGIAHAIDVIRATMPPETSVTFAVQTNGILLNEEFLALFRQHRVKVGVSLDGNRIANDRHRRYASGRSSYDGAVQGIGLLRQPVNRAIFGGLLCTVDLANDPVETYLDLLQHDPPRIDFLLPHGNWVHRPPGLRGDLAGGGGTPYADWLLAIFDYWYGAPRRETGIRIFEAIISVLLGGASDTEAIGLDAPIVITIESDGSIEGSDGLKTTGPDEALTGLTVYAHSIDDAAQSPRIAAGSKRLDTLGPACRQCPVAKVCGGGLPAHRFSADGTYTHPSVYCRDLYQMIRHIRARLKTDIAALEGQHHGVR